MADSSYNGSCAENGNGDGVNVVALHDDATDGKVLELRLAGVSIRKIGREFKLTDKQVLDSLDRTLRQLTPELRIRLFREDLQRLDELTRHWWVQAKSGNAVACGLVTKLMERRASMLGTDAAVKIEVFAHEPDEHVGGTEALLRQLNVIANERRSGGEVLELDAEAEPPPAG